VRTQDDTYYTKLTEAGATEVIPETLESSLMMASHVLSILGMPMARIVRRVQEMRNNKYATLREFFHSNESDDLELPDDLRTCKAEASHCTEIAVTIPVWYPPAPATT